MHFLAEIRHGVLTLIAESGPLNKQITLIPDSKSMTQVLLDARKKQILTLQAQTLTVSPETPYQVFVYKVAVGWFYISSDLHSLMSQIGVCARVNEEYFIQYIICGTYPSSRTPFENVSFLFPGSSYRLENGTATSINSSYEAKGTYLVAIEDYLSESLGADGDIALEYSGGLESNILLHALLRQHSDRLRLYHLTDRRSASSDNISLVQRMADRYKVDLRIIDFEKTLPFDTKPCRSLTPNFPHTGLVNIEYLEYAHHIMARRGTFIVNGTGGDAIFCSHPQKALAAELMQKGNVFSAGLALRELAIYFRAPLLHMYRESRLSFQQTERYLVEPLAAFADLYGANQVMRSEVLAEYICRPKSLSAESLGKVTRRERERNALISKFEMLTSPISNTPGRYIYPFLSHHILNMGLNVASTRLVKSRKDRYYLRKAAFERYGDRIFWETRKGGAMALTQRAFSVNRANIEALLLDSPFVKKDLVDEAKVSRLIHEVAVGAINCPHALIHLFTASMFLKHWSHLPL